MKAITLLLFALLMMFAMAQEEEPPVEGEEAPAEEGAAEEAEEEDETGVREEVTFDDSDKMLEAIKGIAESTVWVIQFHDNDPETGMMDSINTCLDSKQYDEDDYQELNYKYSEIDINSKKFEKALEDLGMNSNEFQATYPVALVMRKRKGLFAWGYDLGQAVCERMWEVADEKVTS